MTAIIFCAMLLALALGLVLFLRMLARRIVAVVRARKPLAAHAWEHGIVLPRSELTEAAGTYGLWFGEGFRDHALIGDVVVSDHVSVSRTVDASSGSFPDGAFPSLLTGHTVSSPDGLGRPWGDVSVPLRGGGTAPAWFFPSDAGSTQWAIHVQGIRTSRLVTLRAVEVAQRAGLASLAITFRGSGDGAPAAASSLGLSEWADLSDAVSYARANGATSVIIIAWSMGAGLALELARREPGSVAGLILICPATNWSEIIRHGAKRAHLPRAFAAGTIGLLGTPLLCRIAGLARPLDFEALDWSRPEVVSVRTLVIHSRGDAEIPFRLSQTFADAHPGVVTLVETNSAPHGWEPNVDPAGFAEAMNLWLARIEN